MNRDAHNYIYACMCILHTHSHMLTHKRNLILLAKMLDPVFGRYGSWDPAILLGPPNHQSKPTNQNVRVGAYMTIINRILWRNRLQKVHVFYTRFSRNWNSILLVVYKKAAGILELICFICRYSGYKIKIVSYGFNINNWLAWTLNVFWNAW